MTYEPLDGGKGMKITIDAVNKEGVASKWGYNTMFDGKDEPLYGNPAPTPARSDHHRPDQRDRLQEGRQGDPGPHQRPVAGRQHDRRDVHADEPGRQDARSVTFATYEKMK